AQPPHRYMEIASPYPCRTTVRAWLVVATAAALQACGGGGGGGGGTPTPPVNQPPTIATIGPRTVAEGATLTIEVSATVPENGTLTFEPGAALPAFVTLVPTTPGRAELRVTPDFVHSGSYTLMVRVRVP